MPAFAGRLGAMLQDQRYRRAGLSFAASAAASGLSMINTIAMVPILLAALGTTRFGAWLTIYSFVALLTFLDLGIGLGVVTRLSRAGEGDDDRVVTVTSAFVVLGIAGASVALLAALASPFVDWASLLGLPNGPLGVEAGAAMTALLLCIAVSIPASLAARVQAGLQAAYKASLWDALARLVTLACLFALIRNGSAIRDVVWLVVGMPVLTSIANSLYLFLHDRPDLAPRWRKVDPVVMRYLLRTGGGFLILQVIAGIVNSSDNLIVSHVLGPTGVTAFAVPRTLFAVVTGMVYLMLLPLWPAYGDALARGEATWVRRTLFRSTAIAAGLVAAGSMTIIVVAPWLFPAWAPRAPVPDTGLLVALGLWVVVTTIGGALAMLLNAAGRLREQVGIAVVMAIVVVAVKVWACAAGGLAAMTLAGAAVYALLSLAPAIFLVRRFLRDPNMTAR